MKQPKSKNEKQDKKEDKNFKPKQQSLLGKVDSGTKQGRASQPMSGNLGKQGEWKADLEAGAANTDE